MSVRAPVRWHRTAYHGMPAPTYFPVFFLSTEPFRGACSRGAYMLACAGQNWFADGWRTPAGGVLILWSYAQFPTGAGPALTYLHGRRTVIAHSPANVWAGPATSRCAAGAATEVDAYVPEVGASRQRERYDMTACFGPNATELDRNAVQRMLLSLRLS